MLPVGIFGYSLLTILGFNLYIFPVLVPGDGSAVFFSDVIFLIISTLILISYVDSFCCTCVCGVSVFCIFNLIRGLLLFSIQCFDSRKEILFIFFIIYLSTYFKCLLVRKLTFPLYHSSLVPKSFDFIKSSGFCPNLCHFFIQSLYRITLK